LARPPPNCSGTRLQRQAPCLARPPPCTVPPLRSFAVALRTDVRVEMPHRRCHLLCDSGLPPLALGCASPTLRVVANRLRHDAHCLLDTTRPRSRCSLDHFRYVTSSDLTFCVTPISLYPAIVTSSTSPRYITLVFIPHCCRPPTSLLHSIFARSMFAAVCYLRCP
jgi:hypothetical protein